MDRVTPKYFVCEDIIIILQYVVQQYTLLDKMKVCIPDLERSGHTPSQLDYDPPLDFYQAETHINS